MWEVGDFIALAALVMSVFSLFFSYRLNKINQSLQQEQVKQDSLQEFRSLLNHFISHQSEAEILVMKTKWQNQEMEKCLFKAPLEYRKLEAHQYALQEIEKSKKMMKEKELRIDETKKILERLWSIKEPNQEIWGNIKQMISAYERENLIVNANLNNLQELLLKVKEYIPQLNS